ncbi:MAG: cell division protein FtsB [Nitrospinales bacterium]
METRLYIEEETFFTTYKALLVNINSNYQKTILLSLGFFMLLIIMAVFHENGILNAYRFEQEQVKMKEANGGLRQQNDLLRQEIVALKTEPYEIEKIAREKLNLAIPGDQIYRIVSTQSKFPPTK